MLIIAVAIFVATLALVIWQPRGLSIGWSALGGGVVALATTVVHLSDIPAVVSLVWNATLTFVAIVIISLILDEVGFFHWAALHMARWGGGSGLRLFALVILLGAAVAALFANDGAALILTPIVVQVLRALKMPARTALAFVLGCGFIADAGSLPLVVSNLVNIVVADYIGIGFARYALIMVPVGLVTITASLGMLLAYFGRAIPRRYDRELLSLPRSAIRDPVTLRAGWMVLGVLVVGYFGAGPLHVPLSAVAGLGAAALMLTAARQPAFLWSRPARLPAGPPTRSGTAGGAANRQREPGP